MLSKGLKMSLDLVLNCQCRSDKIYLAQKKSKRSFFKTIFTFKILIEFVDDNDPIKPFFNEFTFLILLGVWGRSILRCE